MELSMLLEMAAEGCPDRVAVGRSADGLTYAQLLARARSLGARLAGQDLQHVVVVASPEQAARFPGIEGITVVSPEDLVAADTDDAGEPPSGGDIAILLFTSGTSGEPKGAVLRPSHLDSYVLSTVEFLGAEDDE